MCLSFRINIDSTTTNEHINQLNEQFLEQVQKHIPYSEKNIQFHNSHITFLIRPLNRHIQLMLTRRISSYFYEKRVSQFVVFHVSEFRVPDYQPLSEINTRPNLTLISCSCVGFAGAGVGFDGLKKRKSLKVHL